MLFLDEPATGLDLHSRTEVWTAGRTLVAAGATVLLTTQYLEEADQLADHIAAHTAQRRIHRGTPRSGPGGQRAGTSTGLYRCAR